jgi:hypothetical protein
MISAGEPEAQSLKLAEYKSEITRLSEKVRHPPAFFTLTIISLQTCSA